MKILGHCQLKGHLSKLRLVEDTECRFRKAEDETLIYILTESKGPILGSISNRRERSSQLEPTPNPEEDTIIF